MTWLLTMILFIAIFTFGFTFKYKEELVEKKQELLDIERSYHSELLKIQTMYNIEVADLKEEMRNLENKLYIGTGGFNG